MFLFLSVPAMGSLYCFSPPLPFFVPFFLGLTQGASKLMNERQMLGVRDLVQGCGCLGRVGAEKGTGTRDGVGDQY